MVDLGLNDEYGMLILNGDFSLVSDDYELLQRAELIVLSNQGEWKEHPVLGCNLVQEMNSKNKDSLIRRKVRLQLKADGIDYNSIKTKLIIK